VRAVQQWTARFLWRDTHAAKYKLYQRYKVEIARKLVIATVGRSLGVAIMLSILRRLAADDTAATAIEYTLIASLISTAAVGAFTTIGHKVANMLAPIGNLL
jgi:pilus assembly protein Flp/PilA